MSKARGRARPGSEGGAMRARALVTRLVLAAALGLALGGQSAGASSTQAVKPKTGGTLTWLFNTEPAGLGPVQLRESPNLTPLLVQVSLFDELVYTDPVTLKVRPKIATSLTTADKGLTWTLKLHSGVKFS